MSALDGILMLTTFLISILVSPADVKRPPTITSFGCGGKGVSGGGGSRPPTPTGRPLHPTLRIPTIPITRSDEPITDSGGFRSPWETPLCQHLRDTSGERD